MSKKPEHIASRACWCQPLMVSIGSEVLTQYAGTIVKITPTKHGDIAVHIEPDDEEDKA